MKRWIRLLLVLVSLAAILAACGKENAKQALPQGPALVMFYTTG